MTFVGRNFLIRFHSPVIVFIWKNVSAKYCWDWPVWSKTVSSFSLNFMVIIVFDDLSRSAERSTKECVVDETKILLCNDIPRTPAIKAIIRLLSSRVKQVLERNRSRAKAICSFWKKEKKHSIYLWKSYSFTDNFRSARIGDVFRSLSCSFGWLLLFIE